MKAEIEFHENTHARTLPGYLRGKATARGRLLEPGDVLEASDLFESTSGSWETCQVPGYPLNEGSCQHGQRWIRPAYASGE